MNHIYIFDYSTCSLYHGKIPMNLCGTTEIDSYIVSNYNLKIDNIYYMISEELLNITEL